MAKATTKTATTTTTTTTTKATAPAPKGITLPATPAQLQALPLQPTAAPVLANLPAPVGPLYLPNMAHKGAPNMRGLRQYAWQTALVLAKANPQGFALNQLTYALTGCVLPAGHAMQAYNAWGLAAPTGGWAGHNMASWGARPAQAWWVPAPAATK